MSVTENVAHYLQDKGIRISTLAEKTNLPYRSLYLSLGKGSSRHRALRADELMRICEFLELSPMHFYNPLYDEEGKAYRKGNDDVNEV